jgi:hypothetical protein
MTKTSKPDLTLIVRTKTNAWRTWALDPQGRDTFRIIVVCVPENELASVEDRGISVPPHAPACLCPSW